MHISGLYLKLLQWESGFGGCAHVLDLIVGGSGVCFFVSFGNCAYECAMPNGRGVFEVFPGIFSFWFAEAFFKRHMCTISFYAFALRRLSGHNIMAFWMMPAHSGRQHNNPRRFLRFGCHRGVIPVNIPNTRPAIYQPLRSPRPASTATSVPLSVPHPQVCSQFPSPHLPGLVHSELRCKPPSRKTGCSSSSQS